MRVRVSPSSAGKVSVRRRPKINPGVTLVLPAFIAVLAFSAYPLIYNFVISLTNAGAFNPEPNFIGLENYLRLARAPIFWQVTIQTLGWTAMSVALEIIVGFTAALLLNRPGVGRGVITGVALASWATSFTVVAILGRWIFDARLGVINDILLRLHLISNPINWLSQAETARIAVATMNGWKYFPFVMLMFLAGLQGIPEELYESAKIDGATGILRFRFITLPMLKPVVASALFLTTIWALNAFTIIWVMTGGGPLRGTETLPIFIYRLSFTSFNYGAAAAASIYLFCVVLGLAIAYLRIGGNPDYDA